MIVQVTNTGVSVAINGKYAIVGAYGNNPMEAAYIYEIVDNSYTWTEVQKIAIKNSISRGLFGASVAISRNGKYAVYWSMQ